MDDMIVPCSQTIRYALALKQVGISFEMHVFQEGGHGFGGCRENKSAVILRDNSSVAAWKELFVAWALRELDRKEPFDPMAAYKRFM